MTQRRNAWAKWRRLVSEQARSGPRSPAERVRAIVGENPQSGHLFVCRSRRGDRLKILVWERDEIEYIPGHFEHIQHVRQKYACPSCEHQGEIRRSCSGQSGDGDRERLCRPRAAVAKSSLDLSFGVDYKSQGPVRIYLSTQARISLTCRVPPTPSSSADMGRSDSCGGAIQDGTSVATYKTARPRFR